MLILMTMQVIKNEKCYLWMEISQWICDETEVIKSYVMRMNGRRNKIKFFFSPYSLDFNELNFLIDDKTFNLLEITSKMWREQKQNNMKILSRVMMYSSYAQLSWCWPQKVVKSSNNNQISAYLDISKMPFVLSVIHFINVYGCK